MVSDSTTNTAVIDRSYIFDLPEELLHTLRPLHATKDTDLGDERTYDRTSESSDDDSDSVECTEETNEAFDITTSTSKGSPIYWFQSSLVSDKTKLGIYKCMLPNDTTTPAKLHSAIQGKTLAAFMLGGGHFAGAIISLQESSIDKCKIIASKGFHRYTTRRKQGGAQSANDNAKGAANSAGAQIRRYNEIALAEDIRSLFNEWKSMLDDTCIILIRAAGQASRKLLYDNGLSKTDLRVRSFPLTTRRATQSEIVRCFLHLCRVQQASFEVTPEVTPQVSKPTIASKPPVNIDPRILKESEDLVGLIRRGKVTALSEYITTHSIDIAKFSLQPVPTYIHTPTLLHFAAATDQAKIIPLLLDLGADPIVYNENKKTAFEVSSKKTTRDAFRIWRGQGHESNWDWNQAKVPAALTQEQLEHRREQDRLLREAEEQQEQARRKEDLERLEAESEAVRLAESAALAKKRGPGKTIGSIIQPMAQASLSGVAPDLQKTIERERRARAAEARFAKK